MMYRLVLTNQFKKDLKRCDKSHLPREDLNEVVTKLQKGNSLDVKYMDHQLKGDRKGQKGCHIHPDWVLIYRIHEEEKVLELIRTGTHSDLL